MQEQKNKNKAKLCKLRISSEHEQWKRSISESARRLSKRRSIRARVVHIGILNEQLKELNGYDEVMWHLITLMKKKPVLLH
jgi:DNA-directed RNA polymerase subunit E'/Rpb7